MTATTPPPLGSGNFQRRMREIMQFSAGELPSVVSATLASATAPDADLTEGTRFTVAGTTLTALHTPGHSPGSTCLHAPDLATVFTGDTLFRGGPGATGRSYSDKPTILSSIRSRLLALPADTTVHTGHGDDTTIAAEQDNIS